MQVFLDDKPCDIRADCIGDAIAALAAIAEDDGRMIVDVQVDGDAWGEAQLNDRASVNATADEVRLRSAEPRALVAQTLADAADALHDANTLQTDAAELIQSDDQKQGMSKLQDAISIWLGVEQAVTKGTELVGLDLDSCRVGERPAQAYVDRLNTQLTIVRNQLEAGDHLGLADTLLYDLPEIVEEWRTLLKQLQQQVENV